MRLFVGLPVSCADVLGPVRNTLQRLDGVRPVPEGTEHVTLRFFGDVEESSDREAIRTAVGAAVKDAQAMDGAIRHLGMFQDPRHARIVWANLEAEPLRALQQRIVAATQSLGQPEASRQFVPHITLARCKRPQDLRNLLQEFPGPFWQGPLAEVVLFQSHLGPEGPEYERVQTWNLAAP